MSRDGINRVALGIIWAKCDATKAVEKAALANLESVDHLLVECQCQGPSVKNTGCPPLEIDLWDKEVWSVTIADKSIIITNDDAKRLISRFEAMILSSEYQGKDK